MFQPTCRSSSRRCAGSGSSSSSARNASSCAREPARVSRPPSPPASPRSVSPFSGAGIASVKAYGQAAMAPTSCRSTLMSCTASTVAERWVSSALSSVGDPGGWLTSAPTTGSAPDSTSTARPSTDEEATWEIVHTREASSRSETRRKSVMQHALGPACTEAVETTRQYAMGTIGDVRSRSILPVPQRWRNRF
eukprot:133621-Prorocentrum_minimum.AAC.1